MPPRWSSPTPPTPAAAPSASRPTPPWPTSRKASGCCAASPSPFDRQATLRKLELATSLFGDLLPAKLVCLHTYWVGVSLVGKAVMLMGMDNFYMAMLDQPENVHRFFEFVATEAADFGAWLQAENLVRPNHDDWVCGSGSIGYTDELPRRPVPEAGPWLPQDCWVFSEAQESVGISNAMYAEFIFPYLERLTRPFGLLYYGCCEPVHTLWPTVRQFKNLRKVTISPWCDQRVMAEAVGKNYVLSRKPHPMQLCGEAFNPVGFTTHVQETLDIAKDNFVELVFRDTCTLSGAMKGRVEEACGIVKRLVGR